MIETVKIEVGHSLENYERDPSLAPAVRELKEEAKTLVPQLAGRKLWMVNSTAKGGGVAEMMPTLVSILREVGVETEWAVINTERTEFFDLTKRLHNLIHGSGEATLSATDAQLYDTVATELAAEFEKLLGPKDVLAIHDPQPAGMGALLKRKLKLPCLWRCHIGLDSVNAQTQEAWRFLKPHLQAYDDAVFTAPEYIPDYLTGNVHIIHPALDPLSFKNRELNAHVVTGVLANAGLIHEHHPVLTPHYDTPAERLQPDGSFQAATAPEEIGLLYRTVITQISRWDRLKGWKPLMDGFTALKRRLKNGDLKVSKHDRHRLEIMRLVLAGPEPAAVADDPEAKEVLEELKATYCALEPKVQSDVVMLSLPMASRRVNALMVNALQRCSSVVVQNSVQEGFGLTVTEAMWKGVPVLGSVACGIRQQIRDKVDGRLIDDPESAEAVEETLLEVLNNTSDREGCALSARRRAHHEFLVFTQARRWLEVVAHSLSRINPPSKRRSAPPAR